MYIYERVVDSCFRIFFFLFETLLHLLELAASDKSPRRASVDDEARWNETLVVDLSIRGSSAIPSRFLASHLSEIGRCLVARWRHFYYLA